MIVTITEYERCANDANGKPIYLGKDRIACQARTSAGAFSALSTRTKFIRIATDTAIQMNVSGGNSGATDEFFPSNNVEYLAVNGGEVFNIALSV